MNASTCDPFVVAGGWRTVPTQQFVYVTEGALMLVGNSLLVVAIARTATLRIKGYVPLAALALADALSGLTFFATGLWRGHLYYIGEAQRRVTVAACLMLVPHASLLIVSQPLASLMMVCVSVDRLLAVGVPLRYRTFTMRYSAALIGAFALISVFTSAVLIVGSFAAGATTAYTSALCLGSASVHSEWGNTLYFGVRMVSGSLSVLLYGLVPLIRRHRASAMSSVRLDWVNELRRQNRLAVTVGMSVICTLVFFVTPNVVKTAASYLGYKLPSAVKQALTAMQNLNALCNVAIYMKRHSNIRVAVANLFRGKNNQQVAPVTAIRRSTTTAMGK